MIWVPLKMRFFRDSGVSPVLEYPKHSLRSWGRLSSCITYTLRFSVRYFLALTKKSLFLEVPINICLVVPIYFLSRGCRC